LPAAVAHRVGVCVDSQHIFASGYDIVNDYDGVWRHFDDVIGLPRLGMMHLNDSKVPFGCRRDRHQLIGLGAIGEEPFRRIMTDSRLASVAKVIETPKLDNDQIADTCMLVLLRNLANSQERA
jgi:deoxyribonuclease-4